MIMARHLLLILLFVLAASSLFAAEGFLPSDHRFSTAHPADQLIGGHPATAKAEVDSFLLIGPWGSGAEANGQFEDAYGMPNWNGWTHVDLTDQGDPHWQVADFNAENLNGHGAGNLALWCGEMIYPSCSPIDEDGGYGNNYWETVSWTGAVSDPAQPCLVTLDAWLNYDLEPAYDYLYLQVKTGPAANNHRTVWDVTGKLENFNLQLAFQVEPSEYQGEAGNEVVLQFTVMSDGAFSDQDCYFFTSGACQIDDINVDLGNGGFNTFSDFEDGQLGAWELAPGPHVGDFARIWSNLGDVDLCNDNYTPQVAFIDDGLVVPGAGPSYCQDWCYGPNGYVVNTTGGLAGPTHFISNMIISPPVDWPASQPEGALFAFDVYRHEELLPDSPGIFWTWHVRSVNTGDPADLENSPWGDRNFVHYGPPAYYRNSFEVSDLLLPGATHVQVGLAMKELGYVWGWVGDNATPAPYFDNVRLTAFEMDGPAMTANSPDMPQDGFPASGQLDLSDPASLSVRFDMATNIAAAGDPHIDPGDSIVISVTPRRVGAILVGQPLMHYRLLANPAFDAHRTSGLPTQGAVAGSPVTVEGNVITNRFCFDLPDTGFLFPGDVLRYHFEATSLVGGEARTAYLPADTTGFSDWSDFWTYGQDFTVRALPSLEETTPGELFQPVSTLVWLDAYDTDAWFSSFDLMEIRPGHQFDLFITRSPSSGVGNGLGSRATAAQLDGYSGMLYSAGSLSTFTICNGDENGDGSDDLGLLDEWLQGNNRTLFLSGDNLVSDLALNTGSQGLDFLNNWARVSLVDMNLRPLIDTQTAPLVVPTDASAYLDLPSWIAYGGCPIINTFDAVTVQGGAVRLAEFTTPWGATGAYPYAAMSFYQLPAAKNGVTFSVPSVMTLPMSLATVYSDPGSFHMPPCGARQLLLAEVFMLCGHPDYCSGVGGTEIPGSLVFGAHQYPNPFNPVTTIDYTMPRAGHLSIKVFDLKGRLVKILLDEQVVAGKGAVSWSGKDEQGAEVSSGVYFYRVQGPDRAIVEKMALIK
jgi:hypothetical protein